MQTRARPEHTLFDMESVVKPLVDPLPSEMASTIGTMLSPFAFFPIPDEGVGGTLTSRPAQRQKRDDGDHAEYYQAPSGALVFHSEGKNSTEWPEHTTKALSVVFVPKSSDMTATASTMQVLGVVASPIEDPGLVARHHDELAHIAVYVTGAHTILADPRDCETIFPMNYIKVKWETAADQWPRLDTGEELPFYVPRLEKTDPKNAFAMVLQVGTSELRILLLQQRFGR